MFSRIAALVIVIPGLLAAQAAAEAALGSSMAVTTTAPAAQKTGKAIGGAMDKLGKIFDDGSPAKSAEPAARPAPRSAAKSTVAKRRPALVEPAVPAVSYEDPAGIKEGMEYDEVMRRFGPPAMKFTSGPVEEMLTYA